PEPLSSGKDLRPIKNRVVQGNGEDGETESPRPSQKFMRRIIQFVLRIIESVNMEIELEPIACLFTSRAHGRGRVGLRHPKLQARLNNPMTENWDRTIMNGTKRTEGRTAKGRTHRTWDPELYSMHAGPAKTRTLKNFCLILWLGKSACGSVSPIYHLLASKTARVVEWQTRTFEGRMPKGMRVQVPPRAPPRGLRGIPSFRAQY